MSRLEKLDTRMSGSFDEARKQRDEIERYRQRHQGPLLERASEHFAVLTRGAFASWDSVTAR